jgi:hypothetical protein
MKFIKTALAVAALLPVASHATLGGAPALESSTVPAVRAALQAASAAAPYSVHESRAGDGVTVREYTSPANVVFAVTWTGPVRPDLNALLGSYFPNFVAAAHRSPRGTGPLIEREGDLQIESMGHQGNFIGKAWVPRLVPAQVDPADLK